MLSDYIVIDLETTGLHPKKDRIIEVGAGKVRKGIIIDWFETLVNPGRYLEESVCKLTGIRNEDLASAPAMKQVLPLLLAFIGRDILVGHHIIFDYSFLKRAAVNQDYRFEKEGIDTLLLARKFLPELESRTLASLCRFYGIPHSAHRARKDAEATAALYEILEKNFYNEIDFMPKKLIYQAKKESPATINQKERLYKLIDRHKLIVDIDTGIDIHTIDIETLTRSEASRITDKILSACGR